MSDIQQIRDEIVKRLEPLQPERVILFGSYANGTQTPESDIDIYVVTRDDFMPANWKETNKIYLNVSRKIRDIRKLAPVDLIVHTKKMYEKFR